MNSIDLKGRSAVVTGAAQGIGHAIAERLLRSGAEVCLWDIDAARLEKTSTELGAIGRAASAAVDVSDESSVKAAYGPVWSSESTRSHGDAASRSQRAPPTSSRHH